MVERSKGQKESLRAPPSRLTSPGLQQIGTAQIAWLQEATLLRNPDPPAQGFPVATLRSPRGKVA